MDLWPRVRRAATILTVALWFTVLCIVSMHASADLAYALRPDMGGRVETKLSGHIFVGQMALLSLFVPFLNSRITIFGAAVLCALLMDRAGAKYAPARKWLRLLLIFLSLSLVVHIGVSWQAAAAIGPYVEELVAHGGAPRPPFLLGPVLRGLVRGMGEFEMLGYSCLLAAPAAVLLWAVWILVEQRYGRPRPAIAGGNEPRG